MCDFSSINFPSKREKMILIYSSIRYNHKGHKRNTLFGEGARSLFGLLRAYKYIHLSTILLLTGHCVCRTDILYVLLNIPLARTGNEKYLHIHCKVKFIKPSERCIYRQYNTRSVQYTNCTNILLERTVSVQKQLNVNAIEVISY